MADTTTARRQASRRAKLDAAARAAGWKAWTEYETAVVNDITTAQRKEGNIKTVTVRFPTNAEKMSGWRKFERKFSSSENALAWARQRDQQINSERGNLWPREFLVDGAPVIGADNVQW